MEFRPADFLALFFLWCTPPLRKGSQISWESYVFRSKDIWMKYLIPPVFVMVCDLSCAFKQYVNHQ